jgi:hypothetical protein
VKLSILSQPAEKKIFRITPVLIDERLRTAIEQLKAIHGVGTGEYIRGLIYLDALLLGELPEDADCPHWVRRAHPQLFRREAA